MSTTHVPPGEGRHYLMIDGDHVPKAAVQHAAVAFEVFEVFAPAAPMAPPRRLDVDRRAVPDRRPGHRTGRRHTLRRGARRADRLPGGDAEHVAPRRKRTIC